MDNIGDISQVLSSERIGEDNNSTLERYPLPSNWTNFICTWDNLVNVWEKLNQFPILFDDDVRGNFKSFISDMMSNSSIILLTGDYGICEISDIVPYRDCQVHLTFWDRRFKGRDTECKMAIKWTFDKLKLHRITIHIVGIAHSTINFIKALGFRQEGIIRERYPYNGRLLDVHIFGMLRSEAIKDEVKNGKN